MPTSVVVLGAGQSAPYLIQDLLKQAEVHDWHVIVADRDEALARQRVGDHPRGEARGVDAMDPADLRSLMTGAKVVANFLAPPFQVPVAEICVELGQHMVSASYENPKLRALSAAAEAKGVTLLSELGLDPGMDHMSAMKLVHALQAEGARILSFASYGSGVPSPDSRNNPLDYAITWNPRNVVMAASAGAQYLEDGRVKIVPYPEVFARTWPFEVDGVGTMEAYPNRDSLGYQQTYGLPDARTLIRGTLRYPGFSETWGQVARLGMPNETLTVPNLAERTWAEVTEMFLPGGGDRDLRLRTAEHLGLSPTGRIMENLGWLGLFDDTPTGARGQTVAGALIERLQAKLTLPAGGRDMVILAHELLVAYPDGRRATARSTLVEHGEPDGMTAMAKTVGLPAALGVRLLMTDRFPRRGAVIPTTADVYTPLLEALEAEGLAFTETLTSA